MLFGDLVNGRGRLASAMPLAEPLAKLLTLLAISSIVPPLSWTPEGLLNYCPGKSGAPHPHDEPAVVLKEDAFDFGEGDPPRDDTFGGADDERPGGGLPAGEPGLLDSLAYSLLLC